MAKESKSTVSITHSIKGFLNLEDMKVVEVLDNEEVVHDLNKILSEYDGKEVSMSTSTKVKLEGEL